MQEKKKGFLIGSHSLCKGKILVEMKGLATRSLKLIIHYCLWNNAIVTNRSNFLMQYSFLYVASLVCCLMLYNLIILGKRGWIAESLVCRQLFLFFSIILQNFTLKSTVDPKDLDISPMESGIENFPPARKIIFIPRTLEGGAWRMFTF